MGKLFILMLILIKINAEDLNNKVNDFLFDWDRAHNNKDFNLFNFLYFDSVNYYKNRNEDKFDILKDKKMLLKKYPDFNQRSELIKIENLNNDFKIYYNKNTYYNNQKKTFTSYLVLTQSNDSSLKILEENDYKKEANQIKSENETIKREEDSSNEESSNSKEEKILAEKVKEMCAVTIFTSGVNCRKDFFETAIKNGCDKLFMDIGPIARLAVPFFDADPYMNNKECYIFKGRLTKRINKTSAIFTERFKDILIEDLPEGRYFEGGDYLGVVEGNGNTEYNYRGMILTGKIKAIIPQ